MNAPLGDSALVDAVYQRRLPEVAASIVTSGSDDIADLARRALVACDRIGAVTDELAATVLRELDDAGISGRRVGPPGPRQNVEVVIAVADPVTADLAATALEPLGFEPWDRWSGAALHSFHRHGFERTVARPGENSSVVRLRWRPRVAQSTLGRALTPTAGDWSWVDLPDRAWRAYPVVRLARLVAERSGRRDRHADLGPFLATPESLVEPLLDHADVDADDTLVDLGCGDGRIVVGAAERGCRAIGIEASIDLVERGRSRITAASPDIRSRARIEHGDARRAPLAETSVVLLFLPIDVVGDLLVGLLDALPDGGRLVVHEQTPLPTWIEPRPDSSHVVVGHDAVTVAHRWDVSRRRAAER